MTESTGTCTELVSGVTAWVNAGCGWGASNAALIGGNRASLLVDTMWDRTRTADMLHAFAPRLQAAPITQLVNTHADGDHWFGNSLVKAHKRVATKNAARAMARHGPGQMRAFGRAARVFCALGSLPFGAFRNWRVAGEYFEAMIAPYDFKIPAPALPNFTFSGKVQLEVGGRSVQLIELGPAHTTGDLAVLLPEDRVLFAGDVVFSGVLPVLWDGSRRNWLQACTWLLTQRIDVVVPGHGPIGDLGAVETMRNYWQFLHKAALYQFEKGRPPAVAARWIVSDSQYHDQPFSNWEGQERMVINLHAVYRRFMKRGRRVGTWERLMVLKEAAIFAAELERAGGIDRLKPI